MSQSE